MTLLLFLVILSILVFVHELGHFWVAKKNGILVEEFGFGLPPRIWGKKVGETVYSINALPIGGFVKLYGEDQIEDSERAFFAQSKLVRAAVLLAGVSMNFLLGVVLFSVIYTVMGIPTASGRVVIEGVMPNSPAQLAGIQAGEQIYLVEGKVVTISDDFVNLVGQKVGGEVELLVGKDGGQQYGRVVRLVPRKDPPAGEGALGVVVSSTEMRHYPMWQMPVRGAWYGLKEALAWGGMIFTEIVRMISNLLVGILPADVGGPVRIYQATGEVAKGGVLLLLQFMAILSVNLAVFNLLPVPALDGGRMLFIWLEWIRRKRFDPEFEKKVNSWGMAFLLALLAAITLQDVIREGVGK